MGFEFEKMICAFEAVPFADTDATAKTQIPAAIPPPPRLPIKAPFLHAMTEVALLFDHLGNGFGFVRRDISAKIALLQSHPSAATDLTSAVLDERAKKTPPTPSATRTLLRLMWATRFIEILMEQLFCAFADADLSAPSDSDSDGVVQSRARPRTLKDCVGTAYDQALAPHHSWGLRRTVSAALYLLPAKEAFVEKLGVDVSRREEYLARVQRSIGVLNRRMYAFYDLHQLHGAV